MGSMYINQVEVERVAAMAKISGKRNYRKFRCTRRDTGPCVPLRRVVQNNNDAGTHTQSRAATTCFGWLRVQSYRQLSYSVLTLNHHKQGSRLSSSLSIFACRESRRYQATHPYANASQEDGASTASQRKEARHARLVLWGRGCFSFSSTCLPAIALTFLVRYGS